MDGSLTIGMTTSIRPWTSTSFTSERGTGWRIAPDGSLDEGFGAMP
jgi:hypothetical protein